jgi:hypothetical protein
MKMPRWIKKAGLFKILKPAVSNPLDEYTRNIVKEEIAKMNKEKASTKHKIASVAFLHLVESFSDELEKIALFKNAGVATVSGKATTSSMLRAVAPNSIPKVTQVNTAQMPSPVQNLQPQLGAPPVRG